MTKEIFRNTTKRNKQILDAKCKKINQKTIVMSLYYLKAEHNNILLELLQEYEKMSVGNLSKYTGSDYTLEIKEHKSLFQ